MDWLVRCLLSLPALVQRLCGTLDTDFAKIKVGNTRYDILGGQQQNLRLAAQLAMGQKIDSTTGELRDLGEGFTNTRKGILADTFEGKANPLLGFAMRMWRRQRR